jgi:adenylate cyclase class 2
MKSESDMKPENELRILDISPETWIKKLEVVGAKCQGSFYQTRYVYNFTPHREGYWIRLRFDGQATMLTIKDIKKQSIDGTKELEVKVSDFEKTNLILEKLGYKASRFEENFRIKFKLGTTEVVLDKWPMIPFFMEIESKKSKEDVYKSLNILGIDENDVTFKGIKTLYKEEYGIDMDLIPRLELTVEEKRFTDQFI